MKSCILRVLVTTGLLTTSLRADDRRFTYTYEPETPAARTMAFENWTTLGAQRGAATGEANYRQWDLRQEFEYGVTDKYAVGLYLNEQATAFRKPGMTANDSHFDWKGVSLENRYNLLNPAEHAIGVTLYLEGTYSGVRRSLSKRSSSGSAMETGNGPSTSSTPPAGRRISRSGRGNWGAASVWPGIWASIGHWVSKCGMRR